MATQVISFKNTALFRRGMWLSAAALMAFVATPGVLDGSFQREPMTHLIPLCMLGGFWVYFFWRMQLHRLADEVRDCEDHLEVRRGATEEKNFIFERFHGQCFCRRRHPPHHRASKSTRKAGRAN